MIFTIVDPYNLNHECDKKLFELRKLAKFPNIFHGRQIRDHLSSFASLSICLKKNFEVLKQLVINHYTFSLFTYLSEKSNTFLFLPHCS